MTSPLFWMLHLPAALKGAHEGGVIGILQMTAHGDAVGQSGHLDGEGLEQTGEIHGSGLALGVGVGGHGAFP